MKSLGDTQEEIKEIKASPDPVKEKAQPLKAEDIKWDDDFNFDQEEKPETNQAAAEEAESIPTAPLIPQAPQEEPAEEAKSPAPEIGKESTSPKHNESQSAQYEELSSNAPMTNFPETKVEEQPEAAPVEQTGISVPQTIDAAPEPEPEMSPQEARQESSNEGQTERGGDNAEAGEEPKHESETELLAKEKSEEEVNSSPASVPGAKRPSPISEILLSMERKLEEARTRVRDLEHENQQCNPLLNNKIDKMRIAVMEKEKEAEKKKNEELGRLKDFLRERTNGATRENKGEVQADKHRKIDIAKEIEKLNVQRRTQEEKAQSEINVLVEKLRETREKALEVQRSALNVAAAPSQHVKEDTAKIEALTKMHSHTQKELDDTKEQLKAALEANDRANAKISHHQRHIMELEERNAELEAMVRELSQSVQKPVEEDKAEAQMNAEVSAPQVAEAVTKLEFEPARTQEENVGNEARDPVEESNRAEDLSAESGSTALVEKRQKGKDKKSQYERYENAEEFGTTEHNPEEIGVPSNEHAGDQRVFSEVEEAKNPPAENTEMFSFGDSNSFFDDIALNTPLLQVPGSAGSRASAQTSQASSVKRNLVPDNLF
eukprot:TRINITY_DN2511_c0_g6_i1.p1 TRINITY_DN2511_c0_g6~~TRINITY_DN2511_c0_g6_i1.p1  ORF type:complete len:606 (+),score=178.92 TRINITY_DN2511_c0_g6_i1:452-2269(+)